MRKKPKQPDVPAFTPPKDATPRCIWVVGRWAFVAFPYDQSANEMIRSLPGFRWIPETKLWAVPIDSIAGLRGIWDLHRKPYCFPWGEGAEAAIHQMRETLWRQGLGVLLTNLNPEDIEDD